MKTKSARHKPKQKRNAKKKRIVQRPILCEAEVPIGLESVVLRELRRQLGGRMELSVMEEHLADTGAIPFSYSGRPDKLFQLQTVLAIYQVERFDFARPTGILAHEAFTKIVRQLKQIYYLWPDGAFETLGISAAGSDSDVMVRLRDELAARMKLEPRDEKVDMLVRIRRAVDHLPPGIESTEAPVVQAKGWEVLMRLSPRPLSVRFWRVANMEGALNAAVAHCMVMLTRPKPDDIFLNLMCGSGTLLIERMSTSEPRRAIGCDINPYARAAAEQNLRSAGVHRFVELQDWDARDLHLPDAKVDAIVADLPFGIAVGSHDDNVKVYPAMLVEAARVAKPGARFVVMTQEVRLLDELVEQSEEWTLDEVKRIEMRGLHQRIYVLKRNP